MCRRLSKIQIDFEFKLILNSKQHMLLWQALKFNLARIKIRLIGIVQYQIEVALGIRDNPLYLPGTVEIKLVQPSLG